MAKEAKFSSIFHKKGRFKPLIGVMIREIQIFNGVLSCMLEYTSPLSIYFYYIFV